MPVYKVRGEQAVYITVTVEADDEESAIEKADEIFGGLDSYVGNGGNDKLVGTREEEVSLDPGCAPQIDWTAELADPEDDA